HAQLDAFIADEHGRAGNQLADLVLALAAKAAIERVLAVARLVGHARLPFVRAAPARTIGGGAILCNAPGDHNSQYPGAVTPSRGRFGLAARRHDRVDQAPVLRLLRRHETVALQRRLHVLQALAGMADIDLVQAPLELF